MDRSSDDRNVPKSPSANAEVFSIRGVIEGFYGTPYAHEDRLWLLERMGRWGMNRYVYAPKSDPLHLSQWRVQYAEEAIREFTELVRIGRDHGVEVGFSVSPGNSIVYSSADDRDRLIRKFASFVELGARNVTLALDDVSSQLVHPEDRKNFSDLAAAHCDLAVQLRSALGDEVRLAIVPTDYLGVGATPYLEALGRNMHSDIEIAWTGRTVCSPTIRVEEAAARAQTLKRRVVIWDNTPVNDGLMAGMLHLGPYLGREEGLESHVAGFLLNPLKQCRASAITLFTAARFFRNPREYAAEVAWSEAVSELAGEGAPAFSTFASAHRFSPLSPDDRDRELEAAFVELRDRLGQEPEEGIGRGPGVFEAIASLVAERREAADAIRREITDLRLLHELEPWLVNHARETQRIEWALSAIEKLDSECSQGEKMMSFLAMQTGLATLPPKGSVESYGPRHLLYPQLSSMADEAMAFGSDPVLIRDRCLADDFVSLAESRAMDTLRAEGERPGSPAPIAGRGSES